MCHQPRIWTTVIDQAERYYWRSDLCVNSCLLNRLNEAWVVDHQHVSHLKCDGELCSPVIISIRVQSLHQKPDTHIHRQTQRQTHTHTHTHTHTETNRHTDTHRERHTQRNTHTRSAVRWTVSYAPNERFTVYLTVLVGFLCKLTCT